MQNDVRVFRWALPRFTLAYTELRITAYTLAYTESVRPSLAFCNHSRTVHNACPHNGKPRINRDPGDF